MSGTPRLLRILQLFGPTRPLVTPEWLMETLDVSRASIYRDLGALARAGLLERVADQGYVLGPMVVELDRQIRLADPLLTVSAPLLDPLARETGGVVLLCRFHGLKVMCIHQAGGDALGLAVSYERGRAMPLYRGATSKVILANLLPTQLKQLWAAERTTLVEAGLPDDFVQLTQALQTIRATGHCISEGEVDPDVVGFAVALRDGEHLVGSLSIVKRATGLTQADRQATLSRLQSAAGRIEGRLQDQRAKARATKKTDTP